MTEKCIFYNFLITKRLTRKFYKSFNRCSIYIEFLGLELNVLCCIKLRDCNYLINFFFWFICIFWWNGWPEENPIRIFKCSISIFEEHLQRFFFTICCVKMRNWWIFVVWKKVIFCFKNLKNVAMFKKKNFLKDLLDHNILKSVSSCSYYSNFKVQRWPKVVS